jgi:hypothetical protein
MLVRAIELTQEEKELAQEIEFEQEEVFRHRLGVDNGILAHKIMIALISRNGIPQQRERYFCDPEYNTGGRGRSRKEIFERNGTIGEDIFRHGNFLKHLHYFLFGASLPDALIDEFSEAIESCGNVTSGDIENLRRKARDLTRRFRLNSHDAANEFFKLSIDCCIGPSYAASIANAVKQVR